MWARNQANGCVAGNSAEMQPQPNLPRSCALNTFEQKTHWRLSDSGAVPARPTGRSLEMDATLTVSGPPTGPVGFLQTAT